MRNLLNNIDESTREDLTEITKDVGNKIIFMYDSMSVLINEQRSINLLLQTELSSMTKENAGLKHEIRNVAMKLKKLETFMGVDADSKFENFLSETIFK